MEQLPDNQCCRHKHTHTHKNMNMYVHTHTGTHRDTDTHTHMQNTHTYSPTHRLYRQWITPWPVLFIPYVNWLSSAEIASDWGRFDEAQGSQSHSPSHQPLDLSAAVRIQSRTRPELGPILSMSGLLLCNTTHIESPRTAALWLLTLKHYDLRRAVEGDSLICGGLPVSNK